MIQAEIAQKLENIVGKDNLNIDEETRHQAEENTLAINRKISGVIRPASTEEVQKLVIEASLSGIPLYPISKGMNIGYGDKLPVRDGQLIVDLQRMNNIRNFDNVHGSVEVEPGVTQEQLYNFLGFHNSNYWMDATGAGKQSSIVGNTLEGGFGHTPKGNHRETVSDIEVVLGNSDILRTGTFPGLGPDLSGMFIQSNLGIITSMNVELMPIPESYESFLIKVPKDIGLEPLVDDLSDLRTHNILTSLVHIANATRSLVSTKTCPEEYWDTLITAEMAQAIMSTPSLKVGYWSAIGGLYGTKEEVKLKKKLLKQRIKEYGSIMFFSDDKISKVRKITNMPYLRDMNFFKKVREGIDTFEPIHGLMKGVPSDEPLNNIKWRVQNYDDMGLIWYAPTVSAQASYAREVAEISNKLFSEAGFECPLTLTLVKPNRLVGVLSIGFDKSDPGETDRAHSLYENLKKEFGIRGIKPYRSGIKGMDSLKYEDKGKTEFLKSLKEKFDPKNIISPGRYGI